LAFQCSRRRWYGTARGNDTDLIRARLAYRVPALDAKARLIQRLFEPRETPSHRCGRSYRIGRIHHQRNPGTVACLRETKVLSGDDSARHPGSPEEVPTVSRTRLSHSKTASASTVEWSGLRR